MEVKLLGREYRLRTNADGQHVEQVAVYVEDMLRQAQASTTDTQDAAILAALNIASELMSMKSVGAAVPSDRLQALIDLVDSA